MRRAELHCSTNTHARTGQVPIDLVTIKQLARDVQGMRCKMDAIEERIGLIRQALYRKVVNSPYDAFGDD